MASSPSRGRGRGGNAVAAARPTAPHHQTASASASATPTPNVIVPDKEAEIILPPPTALNPIPALPVALRIDNQEQILALLRADPNRPSSTLGDGNNNNNNPHHHNIISHGTSNSFRQLLVFGNESLRTLIMRQVCMYVCIYVLVCTIS